ncbi:MAG: RNA polymerase factor sigma-54, partial [Burkholderiaceae bacterium]
TGESALLPATEYNDSAASDPASLMDAASGDGFEQEGGGELPLEAQDSWLQSPGAMRNGASESQGDALDMKIADVGLRAHLRSQANLLPLSARDRALVCAIIESLDDDGYLRTDLAEIIGALSHLEEPADDCEINTALKLVQSFEPSGVGARGIRECLLLQLEQSDPPHKQLCMTIVAQHLTRLAQHDNAGLARLLKCSVAEADAACAAIRRLNPRPGWQFSSSEVNFIKPDVLVRKVRGKWTVQLNAAIVPRIRLNQSYAQLFQQHREPTHAALSQHLQEARWTLRNVERRFSTILAVAQAIVRRQYAYFEHGPLAMKPLALRDIAQEVGVHESTVCRATNNKYMATPAGLVELKQFFSRPMALASGGACSPTAIRGLVQEIIAQENATRPLSDVQIAEKLVRQGVKVARRTVTKYRQMLRLPAVEQRRREGAVGSAARHIDAPAAATY